MRGLEIYVDDQFVFDLQYSKTFTLHVEPGEHTVKVTNRLYTKKMDLVLSAGETIRLDVGNVVRGLGVLMMSSLGVGPYKVFMRRV